MTHSDDFLSRWSRRKRAVAAAERAAPKEPAALEAVPEETGEPPPVVRAEQPPAPAAPEPEFDIATLPPIESIEAGTDISGFLRPGVPSALRHAALRRAWTTDPVIRSFKGLAENDWDFTSPDTPGFGPLDPGFDVKTMVARLFGEAPPSDGEAVPQSQAPVDEQAARATDESDATQMTAVSTDSTSAESPPPKATVMGHNIVQHGDDAALQQNEADYSSSHQPPRRHGTAVPRVLPD
jgi:Protein of unknown function (DUF3306)